MTHTLVRDTVEEVPVEDRMKFLEKLTLEEKLFWQIKNNAGAEYLLQFDRNAGWVLERTADGQTNHCKVQSLRRCLADHDIDPEMIAEQLTHSILSQTAFAAMIVEEAENLLGTAQVSNSIQATKSFLAKLS